MDIFDFANEIRRCLLATKWSLVRDHDMRGCSASQRYQRGIDTVGLFVKDGPGWADLELWINGESHLYLSSKYDWGQPSVEKLDYICRAICSVPRPNWVEIVAKAISVETNSAVDHNYSTMYDNSVEGLYVRGDFVKSFTGKEVRSCDRTWHQLPETCVLEKHMVLLDGTEVRTFKNVP